MKADHVSCLGFVIQSFSCLCSLTRNTNPSLQAVLYASGSNKWTLYGIVVMCTAVSCLMATVINNFSEKRQYPTYWGPLLWDKLTMRCTKRKS